MNDFDRYELAPLPLGRGGMAYVYEAVQVDTGLVLAMKRPMPYEGAADRLRRESAILAKVDSPHVMPILDAGVDAANEPWYVMPRAKHNLSDYLEARPAGLGTDEIGRIVLDQIASGLQALHSAGLVHRDIKPENLLEIQDEASAEAGRWVVADLGLVRQPAGETTQNLTGSASMLGTAAYAAPEMYDDPHSVTAAADVFSLGRVIGSVATGRTPVPGVPLLPIGELRRVAFEMTRPDPADRPANAAEAVARARELLAKSDLPPLAALSAELTRTDGKLGVRDGNWDVALASIDDSDFVLDDIVRIAHSSAGQFAAVRPEDAAEISKAMAQHLVDGDWGKRNFDFANRHLDWILTVLRSLATNGHLGEFEDVAASYVLAVKMWDRYPHNAELAQWLRTLDGPQASTLARVIRQAGVQEYFAQTFAGRGPFRNPELSLVLRNK